jgi:hypothetical protein
VTTACPICEMEGLLAARSKELRAQLTQMNPTTSPDWEWRFRWLAGVEGDRKLLAGERHIAAR